MAEIITMPRLSDTMTEGVVAQWLKKVGDKISEGDILAEIETDKATMEFESFNEGTLLFIGLKDGEGAPVDSLLAIIGEEGEDINAIIKDFKIDVPKEENNTNKEEPKATASAPKKETSAAPKQDSVKVPVVNTGRIVASPLAKKLLKKKELILLLLLGLVKTEE